MKDQVISHVIKLACGCDGNNKPDVERLPGIGRRICYFHATEAEQQEYVTRIKQPRYPGN